MEKEILTYIVHLPTLAKDINDIMNKWEKEAQADINKLNQDFVRSSSFEGEIKNLINKLVEQKINELFNDKRLMLRLYDKLEFEGFERNCIGCLMVEKQYGKM